MLFLSFFFFFLNHLIRLQMEVETIPEYIEMYHRERNALKAKTAEKDKVISQLADKQEKQRKVGIIPL